MLNDTLRRYAKVAGITYIIVILSGLFAVNVLETGIIVPGNNSATFSNISENEILFRAGIFAEVFMYLLVILLSTSLYVILKTVDKNLALVALLMRVAEAIIGASAAVITGLIPLQLLTVSETFPGPEIHDLMRLLLNVRGSALDIVLMFVGLGGSIFCYLFYISGYVPKFLAGWGIFTYLSMLLLSVTSLVMPDFPDTIKMVFFTPGALFEVLFGLWLLLKGVKVKSAG